MNTKYHRPIALFSTLSLLLVLPGAGLAAGMPAAELRLTSGDSHYQLTLGGNAPFHTTRAEVVNQRIIGVPGQSTLLVLWDEVSPNGDTAPFYAISLDGVQIATVRQTSYELKLRHGEFDPAVSVPPV